jgi:hypothetical protein
MGRGAVTVDTVTVVVHEAGAGNPMFYVTEAQIEGRDDQDALRMVRVYDPGRELVTILLKSQDRESVYRIQIPGQRPRVRR